MAINAFNLKKFDADWQECLQLGLKSVDPHYLQALMRNKDWLPGPEKMLNAFTLPLEKVNYVLFGESPYPRLASANGFAFWDAAVKNLWSPTGLSKEVNRATSLRNIIKMLFIAEGFLDPKHCTQMEISKLDKQQLVQTNDELFNNFIQQGFLLLNATPVLQAGQPHKDARAWSPFMGALLACLCKHRPHVKFILLGRIAKAIDQLLPPEAVDKLYAEHPYNISFITNPKILNFFKPLHLLRKRDSSI